MPYILALKNLLEKAERERDTQRAQVLRELIKAQTERKENIKI